MVLSCIREEYSEKEEGGGLFGSQTPRNPGFQPTEAANPARPSSC
jgi:hypothetical protein